MCEGGPGVCKRSDGASPGAARRHAPAANHWGALKTSRLGERAGLSRRHGGLQQGVVGFKEPYSRHKCQARSNSLHITAHTCKPPSKMQIGMM